MVGELGIIAWGGDGESGVGCLARYSRRKPTFKATILYEVGGRYGTARYRRCRARRQVVVGVAGACRAVARGAGTACCCGESGEPGGCCADRGGVGVAEAGSGVVPLGRQAWQKGAEAAKKRLALKNDMLSIWV